MAWVSSTTVASGPRISQPGPDPTPQFFELALEELDEGGSFHEAPLADDGSGFFTTSFATNGNLGTVESGWKTGLRDGGLWTDPVITAHVALSSQTSNPRAPPFDDSIAHRTGFSADHYVELTINRNSPSGEHEIEGLLRFDITPNNARGYEIDIIMDSGVIVVAWNGPAGNYSPLTGLIATNCTFLNGDKYRCSIVGSLITVTCNGATVLTISDTQWTTGQPGLGLWFDLGGVNTGFGVGTFTASNIP